MTSANPSAAFEPRELIARLQQAARAGGFRVERFGEVTGFPLIALTKRTAGVRPRIYLSAGIHGDEPAPPLTLLALLERGAFDERANWFICPLLNPAGFIQAVRENAEGIDLNRDYKSCQSAEISAHVAWLGRQPNFDLTLCLHEDWESSGFYLYELNRNAQPTLADLILAAVSPAVAIEPIGLIDGREMLISGIIRPEGELEERELWAEAVYLGVNHARLGYTLETPSVLPIAQRVRAMSLAVESAVRGLVTH